MIPGHGPHCTYEPRKAVLEFFAAGADEVDAEFHISVERQLRRGLLIIAGIEFAVAAISAFLLNFTDMAQPGRVPIWFPLLFVAQGCMASAAARLARGKYLRGIAYAIGVLMTADTLWLSALASRSGLAGYALVDLLMVLLITVAVIPSNFWQMLGFGLLAAGVHLYTASYQATLGLIVVPFAIEVPTLILVGLCAFLAGLNYQRLVAEHKAHAAALEAYLRQAQSEHAASLNRIAAALSHELNNPLGALKSSVLSLVTASERMAAQPEPRLLAVQKDLSKVAVESAGRLEDIIRRMQRFSNLDRADVQHVDIKRAIEDVAGLCLHRERVRLDIPELPTVEAQPQALSGALARVLQQATESDGTVIVTGHVDDRRICLRFNSNSSVSLEPTFAVENGRMASTNWDLFHVQQLIRSQGGDLTAEPFSVVITLPLSANQPQRPLRAPAG